MIYIKSMQIDCKHLIYSDFEKSYTELYGLYMHIQAAYAANLRKSEALLWT